jgi:hypothetical protein
VASESTPPPPTGSGAKYAIIGVALFAIAALLWCATQPGDVPQEVAQAVVPDGGIVPPIVDELEIPELEPDSGPPPDGGPIEVVATKRPSGGGGQRSWDDCSGDIPAAEARRIVNEHFAQIRNCYERRLKQNPVLQGSISLAMRVAPDGHVDASQVTGSMHDREVFACVRNVASHMHFPAPGGHNCALIQVPYTFTPQR